MNVGIQIINGLLFLASMILAFASLNNLISAVQKKNGLMLGVSIVFLLVGAYFITYFGTKL